MVNLPLMSRLQLTVFAYETSILINGKHTKDLIVCLDRIVGNTFPWFNNNKLIMNKDTPLALD
jgi:hypothetical protein